MSYSGKEHGLDLRRRLSLASIVLWLLPRGAVVLTFTLAVLPQTDAGSVDAAELEGILTAYFYAIGENRVEEAMSFYHEDSPQVEEVRRELRYGQTAYLQRTTTLSLDLLHRDSEQAVLLAAHRHLRIIGIKFLEEHVETRYVFRLQGDEWKLWSSINRSPRN